MPAGCVPSPGCLKSGLSKVPTLAARTLIPSRSVAGLASLSNRQLYAVPSTESNPEINGFVTADWQPALMAFPRLGTLAANATAAPSRPDNSRHFSASHRQSVASGRFRRLFPIILICVRIVSSGKFSEFTENVFGKEEGSRQWTGEGP